MDATITNILEGIVAYDALPPEPPKSQTTPTATPSVLSSSSPPLKSGDLRPRKYYSAAMEAMHRQLSLNERKQQLLEKARRYIYCTVVLRATFMHTYTHMHTHTHAHTHRVSNTRQQTFLFSFLCRQYIKKYGLNVDL